jgi:hypothetical protein
MATRIALALMASLAMVGASTASAGDKQRDAVQSNTGAAQSSAQHDPAAAGAQNGQPHPADVPGQSESAPGQAGATPGQSGAESPGQAGTSPGQAGVTPGDQRQQGRRPADMDGPTADDAGAGADTTRKD